MSHRMLWLLIALGMMTSVAVSWEYRLSGTNRLEVRPDSTSAWGTVCDDGFAQPEAVVACRSLGRTTVGTTSYFTEGRGSGTIYMDDVRCSGSETELSQCSFISTHNCVHGEDVGVYCSSWSYWLVGNWNADGTSRGRLEVRSSPSSFWGTVCNAGFSGVDAAVACRSLGCSTSLGFFTEGTGSGTIYMNQVGCSGNEPTLATCSSVSGGTTCTHSQDIGLDCGQCTTRWFFRVAEIVGQPTNCTTRHGRLEVRPSPSSFWGTVCNAGFSGVDAAVACRSLGCSTSLGFFTEGTGSGTIYMNQVACTGNESDLSKCQFLSVVTACGHTQDIGIRCTDCSRSCSQSFTTEGSATSSTSLSSPSSRSQHSASPSTVSLRTASHSISLVPTGTVTFSREATRSTTPNVTRTLSLRSSPSSTVSPTLTSMGTKSIATSSGTASASGSVTSTDTDSSTTSLSFSGSTATHHSATLTVNTSATFSSNISLTVSSTISRSASSRTATSTETATHLSRSYSPLVTPSFTVAETVGTMSTSPTDSRSFYDCTTAVEEIETPAELFFFTSPESNVSSSSSSSSPSSVRSNRTIAQKGSVPMASVLSASDRILNVSFPLGAGLYLVKVLSATTSFGSLFKVHANPSMIVVTVHLMEEMDWSTFSLVDSHHFVLSVWGTFELFGEPCNATVQLVYTCEILPLRAPSALEKAVTTTFMSATAASSLMMNPVTALTNTVSAAIVPLAECIFSDIDPLDPSASPIEFAFGMKVGRYYRGAVVVGIVFFVGTTALAFIISAVVPKIKPEYSSVDVRHAIRFPSIMLLPMGMFNQGIATCAIALIRLNADPWDAVLAWTGLAIVISSTVFSLLVGTVWLGARKEPRKADDRQSKMLLFRWILRACVWELHWVNIGTAKQADVIIVEEKESKKRRDAQDEANILIETAVVDEKAEDANSDDDASRKRLTEAVAVVDFKKPYQLLIDDMSAPWWIGVELAVSALLGGILGIRINDDDICRIQRIAILVIVGIVLLAVVVVRPCGSHIANFFLILSKMGSFVVTLLVVLYLATFLTPVATGAATASASVGFAAGLQTAVQICAQLTVARKRVLAMFRAFLRWWERPREPEQAPSDAGVINLDLLEDDDDEPIELVVIEPAHPTEEKPSRRRRGLSRKQRRQRAALLQFLQESRQGIVSLDDFIDEALPQHEEEEEEGEKNDSEDSPPPPPPPLAVEDDLF